MSSTEQAPEPTMDEILASIRKIIADDDENPAQESDAAAASDQADDAAQGNLVDDIASALPSAPDAGHTAAGTEDDIFDLTNEVPQGAAAEQATYPGTAEAAPGGSEAPAPPADPAFPETPVQPELPPAAELGDTPAAPATEPFAGAPSDDVLAGAPMEQTALPDSAAGFTTGEPETAAFDTGEPRFGDGAPETGAGPASFDASMPETAEPPAAEPGSPELPSYKPSEPLPGGMSDIAAVDTRPDADDAGSPGGADADQLQDALATALPEEMPAPDAPLAASAAEPVGEAESGAEPESVGGKSLEDSVKEMLRPMLRAWLDEHMPQIVESAVKKELQ